MNKAFNTLIGTTIKDFVVVSLDHIDEKKRKYYKIRCNKCGRESVANGSDLVRGLCTTHKATCTRVLTKEQGSLDKRFHNIWANMRKRTTNPNNLRYSEYGGRGINSDVFESYVDFYDLMHESYTQAVKKFGEDANVSIDRIDVNSNYTKENCRWIPMAMQSGNTRRNKLFKAIDPDGNVYYGKNQTLFGKRHGMNRSIVQAYISGEKHNSAGWKFELVENPETISQDMIEDNMV